jgi:transcriptional regulator with GAF, ATPase, and Fis domain
LERAIILSNGSVLEIDPEVFGASSKDGTINPSLPAQAIQRPAPQSLESMERYHILTVLKQADGVIDGPRGAAKILGLHPNTLRSRMKKLGITRPNHETS